MPELLASALAREHAEELVRLEVDEIKRLRRTYEKARKEILARLAETPGDTFTAQQLRSVQVQIEAGLQGMVKTLKADTSAQIEALTTQGIEQTVAEISWWDKTFRGGATQRIAGDAARRVLKPQALLLNQYEASIDAYGLNLISEVQGRLGVHLVKNSSWREMSLDIAGKLENNAIQGARWRAERIVRTEVVDALSLGHMAGLEESREILPGLKGQWDATEDKRSSAICLRLNGRVRELGQPYGSYRGQPIVRPPAIPNCRSRVVPWHEDWADLDDTIDPKSAPKPVVKKHEPGPKPVTKTAWQQAAQAAHQAVVKSVTAGGMPSVTETQSLSATARAVYRAEGLSGGSLDRAVAKRIHDALAEGQKKAAAAKAKGGAPKPSEKKPRQRKSKRERLAESVRREEREIRSRRNEYAVAFDSDGTVLLKKTTGRRAEVSFTKDELAVCRGKVFTHNHPSGSSFSRQDVLMAMHHGLAEMRVTGSRGHTYSLKPRPDRPWSSRFFERSVAPAFKRHSAAVQREQWTRIRRDTLTTTEANFRHSHLVWTRVAREVGMIYSRRKVAP